MENYDKIVIRYVHEKTVITYGEHLMYLASPEKDWYCIEFTRGGDFHRLDGPAVIYEDGDKVWYVNGKRHRLDGPAWEWEGGDKWWFVDGKCYWTEQEYLQAAEEYKNGKL